MPNAVLQEFDLIGETAGHVWRYLQENGPVTLTRLAKDIDAPRDIVMQGVGWLAREGKVTYYDGARTKRVGLV
ncbi:MAG: hypothetical protein DWQ34_03870 [Planctomycetota bacterium]|nr:MAG: hypothetical protein DWQ29_10675 [Planctomycetota bacterium]REJ96383.1 MAG: hypothetical protein DWQ34_03870 [Planctomycetota bacterium]REK29654.1 MAG: hypothetical protein DWQ41_03175 [Planctomycetota bacterium]REK30525.1 MAG: hypothetical protein DWQ45_21860 [Planctomycetota bacterium]